MWRKSKLMPAIRQTLRGDREAMERPAKQNAPPPRILKTTLMRFFNRKFPFLLLLPCRQAIESAPRLHLGGHESRPIFLKESL